MKKLFLPLFAILLLSACEKERIQFEMNEHVTSPSSLTTSHARNNKVNVCHKGKIINININALQIHQAHGDAIDLDGDGYFGTWHGLGTDTDGFTYDMEVDLACDFSSGIVDYGFCTGTLTLVSQSGNSYEYSETVTSGCINNCTVLIEVLADGSLAFIEDCGIASLSANLSLN
jgi:hypothetical protein